MSPAIVTAPPWTIDLPGRPLTVNNVYGRLHHHARAKAVDAVRRDAGILVRAAGIPRPLGCPIAVTSQVVFPNRLGLTDPAAELPVAKAAIDALDDVGVIPNDTGEWVRSLTFLPCVVDPHNRDAPFVRLTITPLESP